MDSEETDGLPETVNRCTIARMTEGTGGPPLPPDEVSQTRMR